MQEDIAKWLAEDESKLPYILTGRVIANFNPLHPCCVQVNLPDHALGMGVTAWARVAMPFAGGGRGSYSLPDIGDEVVVAFCHGEIDSPIVIGSLYSPLSLPPLEVLNPLNNVKLLRTRIGHTLKLDDIQGIELTSAIKQGVKISDTQTSVTMQDSTGQTTVKITGMTGSVEIKGLGEVSVKSGACQITVDGKSQNVSVKAPTVNIEALQALNLKGMQVNIQGQMVSVQAAAQLDVKSSGIANIKGSMVKIN